tara:strand:- start:592 stop:1197 length:606 start_codon:yes stop_codon:yes gene_type:complete
MIYQQSNLSFVSEKIPDNLYRDLLAYTRKRRGDETWNYNTRLAGALEQQSSLSEWKHECPGFEDYVVDLSRDLWNEVYETCPWDFQETRDVSPFIKLRNLWVNYQRQNEYNPVHTHSGIVSFVIFVDIPYGAEERTTHRSNGAFQLEAEVLPVDKSWNGVILMFPSTTKHAVYPFKSTTDERVTVSGNLTWNVEGPDEEHY